MSSITSAHTGKEMRGLKVKEFVISLVSLMHIGWQWGVRFPDRVFAPPEKLIYQALKLGYAGVQALPVRGFTGLNSTGVLLYEDAWNAVSTLSQALRHRTGASGLPSCINDWVVSPSPSECREVVENLEFRGIPQVVHSFDGHARHLVEVHPGLDMTPKQIVDECQRTGQRLVLDTEHLTRSYRDYEIAIKPERAGKPSPLGCPFLAASILSPLADAFRLKPIRRNIDEFVRLDFSRDQAEKTLIELARANATKDLIMVAEYRPTKGMLLSPRKSLDIAARVLEVMHRLVES